MKKLFLGLSMGLSLIGLLAGCASHESNNDMGGTSDQYNQSYESNSSPSDQFNNNATHGTGTSTATNDVNRSSQ